MMKVVFVTSHPIQYQVPVFRHLAEFSDIELTVLFAMLPGAETQGAGFGVAFEWDIPLLEGYRYEVLENVSKNPGFTHFSGCDTPGLKEVLRSLGPDAVIVNGWVVKTCLQALGACRRQGIPCLVRGEANDLRRRAWWKRFLQRVLVKQYAACLYIGQANRTFYEARGVESGKLFPAKYCIENDRFQNAAAGLSHRRDELREQWGIGRDSVCFLYSGKFEEKKHPVELVRSFALASRETPKLHLLMVGDGELRANCERLAAESGIPVTFTGFLNQSEIIAAYVAADCLVLPSDAGETWGLVVNEAMACGLPAIVSDRVGCAADLVAPGETGEVFVFGDWQSLAGKMSELAESGDALKEMGTRARTLISGYSPAHAAEGMRRAMRSVTRR